MKKTQYVAMMLLAICMSRATVLCVLLVVGALLFPHNVSIVGAIVLCVCLALYHLFVWRGLMRPVSAGVVAEESMPDGLSSLGVVVRLLRVLLTVVWICMVVVWLYDLVTAEPGSSLFLLYYVFFNFVILNVDAILKDLQGRLLDHSVALPVLGQRKTKQ